MIKEVLTTNKEFVETYKYHDFLPNHQNSLVYSYKVTTSNEYQSETLGVLCLCFKFQDEMDGIFKNLVNTTKKEAITLLNNEGKVIATSDPYQIPLGAKLELITHEKYKIVTFGGRDYIAKSKKTNGYQNYFGLGWYGHIMIPLEHAFREEQTDDFEIAEDLLLSILQNGERFSNALKSIPLQANNIQKNLNRTIWNGIIKQGNAQNQNKQFSKSLMQEIRQTGESTKSIIGSSIANLTKTIILGDSVFYADLIVDIMDRNLYERANDCRWWALTSEFKKNLQQESIKTDDTKRMCEILKYINALYTVYTNLLIYDKNGIIVAVSNEQELHLVNTKLATSWVTQTLQLGNSSKYCVSPFAPTPLYNNEYTYIYNAPITNQNNENILGGIAIVFDSKEQFSTMIEEALPKKSDGTLKEGVFATIATKEMMVIASSYDKHCIGSHLDIDSSYFTLNPGESASEIIIYEEKYYALGVKCSKGYREYKSQSDDYSNDVYTLFFSYISDIQDSTLQEINGFSFENEIRFDTGSQTKDIATFMIGNQWLGIEAQKVVEAVSVDELKSTVNIDPNHHFKGTLIYEDKAVMVIDIKNFLQENVTDNYQEIIIIKYGETSYNYLGIFVNTLEYIYGISHENIKTLHNEIIGNSTLVESIVFPENRSATNEVLSILSINKIIAELVKPQINKMIQKQVKH